MIDVFSHIFAFVLGILSTLIHRAFKTWDIKKSVKCVLIDFATLWETLREDNLWPRKIMPLVKKAGDMRAIIMDVPTALSNSDLSEALSIADQLIYIKASADNADGSVLNKPLVFYKTSIDELAKRARECVAKMDKWRYK
jgi:hypothetical protein